MQSTITITTDSPHFYSFLKHDMPDGVKIISEQPLQHRGAGVSINVDIQLVIDVAQITPYLVAAWLAPKCLKAIGHCNMNINRKQLPIDQANAIEFVAKEIEEKKKD